VSPTSPAGLRRLRGVWVPPLAVGEELVDRHARVAARASGLDDGRRAGDDIPARKDALLGRAAVFSLSTTM